MLLDSTGIYFHNSSSKPSLTTTFKTKISHFLNVEPDTFLRQQELKPANNPARITDNGFVSGNSIKRGPEAKIYSHPIYFSAHPSRQQPLARIYVIGAGVIGMMIAFNTAVEYSKHWKPGDPKLQITVIDKTGEAAAISTPSYGNGGNTALDGAGVLRSFPVQAFLDRLMEPVRAGGFLMEATIERLPNGEIRTQTYIPRDGAETDRVTMPVYKNRRDNEYMKKLIDKAFRHKNEMAEHLRIKTLSIGEAVEGWDRLAHYYPEISEKAGYAPGQGHSWKSRISTIIHLPPEEARKLAEEILAEAETDGQFPSSWIASGYEKKVPENLTGWGRKENGEWYIKTPEEAQRLQIAKLKAGDCGFPDLQSYFLKYPDDLILSQPGGKINSRRLVQALQEKMQTVKGVNFEFIPGEIVDIQRQRQSKRIEHIKIRTPQGRITQHAKKIGGPGDRFVFATGGSHNTGKMLDADLPDSSCFAGVSISIPVPDVFDSAKQPRIKRGRPPAPIEESKPLVMYDPYGSPVLYFDRDPDTGKLYLKLGGYYAFAGSHTPSLDMPEIQFMLGNLMKWAAEIRPDIMKAVLGGKDILKDAITLEDIKKVTPWVGTRHVSDDLNPTMGFVGPNCYVALDMGSIGVTLAPLIADVVVENFTSEAIKPAPASVAPWAYDFLELSDPTRK